jgi:hypothetical protein
MAMPIAERALSADDGQTVTVEIYAPEPDPASSFGDWRCPFRLRGALDIDDAGHGVDSLQALLNATQGARKYLDGSGLVLTWAGGEPGVLGIPRVVPEMFGRAFAQDIEGEIDRRVTALGPASRPS